MDELRTLDDLDVEGQRVLLRADLNVPVSAAASARLHVADDARIRSALPTIEELRLRGARLVLASHLANPEQRNDGGSMRPVAERLEQLTGMSVPLASAVVGRDVRLLTERLLPGAMLMLENVRLEPGERRNDPMLAAALAELADIYVNDDFASSHCAYASTEGVSHLLPSAAGRLVEHEVGALNAILDRPNRPLTVILGGARLRAKIALVRRFLEIADVICIGGAVAVPFLAAQGHRVGACGCPTDDLALARAALTAAGVTARVELPQDLLLAVASGREDGSRARALDGVDVPDGWIANDIGPRTASRYAAEVAAGATVFWNGPMGRSESARFATGTRRIAGAVAHTPATTVVSGAHAVEALRASGLQNYVSHVSTGGDATLEFLEGHELPGIRVLMQGSVTDLDGCRSEPSSRRAPRRRPRPVVT